MGLSPEGFQWGNPQGLQTEIATIYERIYECGEKIREKPKKGHGPNIVEGEGEWIF